MRSGRRNGGHGHITTLLYQAYMKSGKGRKGKRKRTADDQSGGESSEHIKAVRKIRTTIPANPKSRSHSISESGNPNTNSSATIFEWCIVYSYSPL
jgi:hypothetical protein